MSAAPAGTTRARGRASRTARIVVGTGVGLLLPPAIFYGLRAGGLGTHPALLASTLISAATGVGPLLRGRRDASAAYLTAMLVGSVAVSTVSGSERFLLARDAALTGVTGVWFLVSAFTAQPLTYVFTRPLLEGRFGWPGSWDSLRERSPGFGRMWRVSSVMWAVGLLADAAGRVVMAYTLAADTVPALSTALYASTAVLLVVITNAYYITVWRAGGFGDGTRPRRRPVRAAGA